MSGPTVPTRQARVLRILSHLQSGDGLNANQLARQMDVCRRTIFRDLSLMREAGVDVYFDDDMDCYRLSACNDLVVTPTFELTELTTLVAAVHFSVLQGLPTYSDMLRRSTAKLLSRSPHDVRHSVSRLVNSCSVRTPPDYPVRAVHAVHHVLQAIRQRRTLQLKLGGSHRCKSLDTRLSPYEMIATSETWEVTGRSSYHHEIRTFDSRNIEQADITDEIYAIPRGFQSRR